MYNLDYIRRLEEEIHRAVNERERLAALPITPQLTKGQQLKLEISAWQQEDEPYAHVQDKFINRGIANVESHLGAIITNWTVREWDALESTVDEMRPSLVVVDSFDENSAAASLTIKKLEKLSSRFTVPILVIHHINKSKENRGVNKLRGSSAIAQLQTVGLLPPCVHLANSAATLQGPEWHYDLVRVGLGLYGIHPASHLQERLHLKPVLGVKAKITQIKNIPAGTGVSYGHQFISDRPLKIAVVGIGYADGVPRNLSNRLRVLVRGQWVRQIGAITMDQMMLDVSHLPDLQETEVVTLIGQDGTQVVGAVDWAHTLQTIPWEILCGFKHRLPRIMV